MDEVSRLVKRLFGQFFASVYLIVTSTSTVASTFRLSASGLRGPRHLGQLSVGKSKERTTVLYKKIRLRCTKLYFCWQTVLPIALKLMNFLLESSNNHMKNKNISKISEHEKILACRLLQHVDSHCKTKTERDIWKQRFH